MSKAMKIVMVVLGIILVVVIAAFLYIKSMMPNGDGDNDITEGYYKRFRSDAPLEMKYAQPGSYEIGYTEFVSDNASIGKVRVWYPQELAGSDKSWPMILVVNASGTPASSYEPFFPRLASWGFVVVGNEDGQTGNGKTASITLDCMLNLPDDSAQIIKMEHATRRCLREAPRILRLLRIWGGSTMPPKSRFRISWLQAPASPTIQAMILKKDTAESHRFPLRSQIITASLMKCRRFGHGLLEQNMNKC